MIYKKYGSIFRILRKQNGFKLTDFSVINLSTSTLSEFERGISMMSLDKVVSALQLMGYSLGDFDKYLNYYRVSDSIEVFQKIEKAILSRNLHEIVTIQKLCKDENYNYLYLTLKFPLNEGTLDDKEKITNFLYQIKIFSRIELLIFYIMIPFLPPKDIHNILKKMKNIEKNMIEYEEYHRILSHVIFEIIFVFCSYGLKKEAQILIEKIEKLNLAHTLFLNNLFYGIKGYWIYNFESKTKGKLMVSQFLEIQKRAGQPDITSFYKEKFENVININEQLNII